MNRSRLGAFAAFVGSMVAAPMSSAQSQASAPRLYEEVYLKALTRLPAWVDTLDVHFDSWIQREKQKQATRRVDRFAKALYRLCASKDELALSIASPMATDEELQSDARRVFGDLTDVRDRFNSIGEMIARTKGAADGTEVETLIRNGLSGKILLIDELVYRARQPKFDRGQFLTQAKAAGALCRQSQLAASLFAARLSGS